MANKDYYDILWVSRTADKMDIKKAYKKMAMKYHPDRNQGDKEAEAKFKEINEAYSVLSDSVKKQQYDRFGSVWWNPFGGWAGGFNVDVDLGDIFESFFWWGFSWGSRRKRSSVQKWEDLEYRMNIDLKTSIYWVKQTIKYNRLESCDSCDWEWGSSKKTCHKCNWSGQVVTTQNSVFWVIQQARTCDNCSWTGEEFEKVCDKCHWKKRVQVQKDLEVDIPAGIDNGMIIKISWEWNHWIGTKATWDLYIKFWVSLEEKGLRREDTDLFYNLEISVLEAILWTKKEVNIPIIWKRIISIKAWTQFGSTIKVHGDWVKYIDSDKKGDLFVELDIKIPKKLWKTERDLYEEIAKEKKINVNNKKGVFEGLFG